jgi:formimidoylglutamate deiminase
MYASLERLDPDTFEAIAAQAYVEMLKAGYGSVGEFHYVHHDVAGKPYADPAELGMRIAGCRERHGHWPDAAAVFYAHAGFGGLPPMEGQRRFIHSVESVRIPCRQPFARVRPIATSSAWRRTACAR